jgi:hypothetical protein
VWQLLTDRLSVLVLDEGHKIRNEGAEITKLVKVGWREAAWRDTRLLA